MKVKISVCFFFAIMFILSAMVSASSTPSGTEIINTAIWTSSGINASSKYSGSSSPAIATVSSVYGVDLGITYGYLGGGVDPLDVIVIPFRVTNTGNITDRYELTWSDSGTGALTWVLYNDINGNGVYDTGDTFVIGANTGSIGQNEWKDYLAVTIVPAGAVDTSTSVFVINATSEANAHNTNDTKTVTHIVRAPVLTAVKTVDLASAKPGDIITYTITITNIGTGAANSLILIDNIPIFTKYVEASNTSTAMGTFLYQHVSTGLYDTSETEPITSIKFLLDTLEGGTSFTITFKVKIN